MRQMSFSLPAAAVCLALGLSAAPVHAGLVGSALNLKAYASFSDDNGSYNLPFFNGSVTVGAGAELDTNFSQQLTQGGFATASNVFSGRVGVDIFDTGMTVTYSGQAQPAGIYFEFTSIAGNVIGLSESNSGVVSGVNFAFTPSFTSSSVTNMGFFLLGYQPGTALSQTVNLTFGTTQPPTGVPEPGSLALAALALLGAAGVSRRRS